MPTVKSGKPQAELPPRASACKAAHTELRKDHIHARCLECHNFYSPGFGSVVLSCFHEGMRKKELMVWVCTQSRLLSQPPPKISSVFQVIVWLLCRQYLANGYSNW